MHYILYFLSKKTGRMQFRAPKLSRSYVADLDSVRNDLYKGNCFPLKPQRG